MSFVLDACALIAYLRDEPGAAVVEEVLLQNETPRLVHAVNLCEVYYQFLRATDERTAQRALAELHLTGLLAREDLDRVFWQQVGKYKVQLSSGPRSFALADCFALALAHREHATLVTSDHGEFDQVAEQRICPVRFIR